MGNRNMDAADHAVIRAWINGVEIHKNEEHPVSLVCRRTSAGVIYSANMALYDDSAQKLEMLVRSANEITFQYGWDSRPGPMYHASITTWRKEFRGNSGVTINLEISGAEVIKDTNPPKVNIEFKDKKPSDIAREVANKCGWKVLKIDSAIEAIKDPDQESSKKAFYWENENGSQFIRNKLQPYCHIPGKGMVKAVWGWDPEASKITFRFVAADDPSSMYQSYRFIVGGDDERVIVWAPEYSWGVRTMVGACKLVAEGLSAMHNKKFRVEVEGSASQNAFKVERRVPISATNMDNAKQEMIALWKEAFAEWGKAKMTVVGDSQWVPNDKVEVIAYNKHGGLDPTSGTYVIESGEDVIDGSGFRSTWNLIAVADAEGKKYSEDPTVKVTESAKTEPEQKNGYVFTDQGSGATPGNAGGGGGGPAKAGEEDYTFQVTDPRVGDLVVADRKGSKTYGTYISKGYVRVDSEPGGLMVKSKDFGRDAVLSYRRKV